MTKQYRKLLNYRYSKYPAETCFYCGTYAEAYDHVPPIACMCEEEGLLIPACSECNGILGSSYIKRLRNRKAYLLKTYKKKYKKLMEAPCWTEEELNTLSYDLRVAIETSEIKKAVVFNKLNHLSNLF